MVFSKAINTAGKVLLVVAVLSILTNLAYVKGADNAAHNACVRDGFHSGFATSDGIICVYHVKYVVNPPTE